MTEETKFDPDWKHGWDIVLPDNRLEDVQLLATDCPGGRPVVIMDRTGGIWKFSTDGEALRGDPCLLVNRPAPKASGTSWIVVLGAVDDTATFFYNGEETEERAREAAASFLRRGCRVLAIKSIDWTEGEGL